MRPESDVGYGVTVRRRFVERGRGHVVAEAERECEVQLPPQPGQCLLFGSLEVVVSQVRIKIGEPSTLGVQHPSLLVLGCKEPVHHLEAALASGWRKVDDDAAEVSATVSPG
jgi:hypothetical protein